MGDGFEVVFAVVPKHDAARSAPARTALGRHPILPATHHTTTTTQAVSMAQMTSQRNATPQTAYFDFFLQFEVEFGQLNGDEFHGHFDLFALLIRLRAVQALVAHLNVGFGEVVILQSVGRSVGWWVDNTARRAMSQSHEDEAQTKQSEA
jgi:hypothetical protein